jgi:DNA-binding CsgD family transcriptional regulator
MMPAAYELPTGIVSFTLDRQAQGEAVYLTLRPVSYFTTCGAWQVRVEPERMQWTHDGVCVTLGEGMDVAWGDAHQNGALGDVRALLPQLKLPDHLWAWRIDCRVVALTPNQVLIALWTFHSALGDLVRSLEERIKALERMTSAQVTGSEIPPHPLKDRRKKVLELRREGKSLKEIAKEIGETVHIVKADVRWLHQKGYL